MTQVSNHLKKNMLYYSFYAIANYIFYIVAISFAAFIYFILQHSLGDIDTWIGQNSWELIIISKLLASTFTIKIINLNNNLSVKKFVKKNLKRPNSSMFAVCLFLIVTLYALISQFTVGVIPVQPFAKFSFQSAFGAFFFYFIDFGLLIYLSKNFKLEKKLEKLIFVVFYLSLFLIISNFTMPYFFKFAFFVTLNMLFMTFILIKERNALVNCFIYCILVACPIASIYGLDLILADELALYTKPKSLPYIGISLTWCISYLYYFRRV